MANRFVLPLADVGSGIKPPDGAQLFFSDEGLSFLSDPKDTFNQESADPGEENANPVVANSVGVFPQIWIEGRYRVVLKDKNDVQIWQEDPVSSLTAAQTTYLAPYTGSAIRSSNSKHAERVTPEDFEGDDDTRVAAMFAASNRVRFNEGVTYNLTQKISKAVSGLSVIAWGATINIDGPQNDSGFVFGSSAVDSLPNFKDFSWEGGRLLNADGSEAVDRGFIQLLGMEDFYLNSIELEEVGNGGILMRSGCRNGEVARITIPSFSANAINRGIWLNGSDASDWEPFLIDERSITRNANALPVGGLKNITLYKCKVVGIHRNIYLDNAQHTTIEKCELDISTGGLRNLTINTYSPYTKVLHTHFTSSAAVGNKAILITQFSHDVLIQGCDFTGDYGNAQCIHPTYLAEVDILDNVFAVDNQIPIVAEMGASGRVMRNIFKKQPGSARVAGDSCFRYLTIGNFETANPSTQPAGFFGETATTPGRWRFEYNDIFTRNSGARVKQQQDLGGTNEVGMEYITSKHNNFHDWATASNAAEFPLEIESIAIPANVVNYLVQDNIVFPKNSGKQDRNRVEDPNAGAIDIRRTGQMSDYREGTFIPVIMDGDADPDEGQTYVGRLGVYTLNGNICTFHVEVAMSSLGSLTPANFVLWGGLPFVARSRPFAGDWPVHVSGIDGLAITAGVSLSGNVKSEESGGRIFKWDLVTGHSNLLLSELTDDGVLVFGGSFEIEGLPA